MRKQLRGRQVWQEGGNKKKKREKGKGKASSPCTFINTYLLILILKILNFDIKSRLNVWLELRKTIKTSNKNEIEALGINKATLVDYLNLQSLGIRDYQKILAEVYNAKPLTIRDRIAYARRHKWIEPVEHGNRTSQMTRITK